MVFSARSTFSDIVPLVGYGNDSGIGSSLRQDCATLSKLALRSLTGSGSGQLHEPVANAESVRPSLLIDDSKARTEHLVVGILAEHRERHRS